MATSSIYHNVVIDTEEKARLLLEALESSKEAVLKRGKVKPLFIENFNDKRDPRLDAYYEQWKQRKGKK